MRGHGAWGRGEGQRRGTVRGDGTEGREGRRPLAPVGHGGAAANQRLCRAAKCGKREREVETTSWSRWIERERR